MYYYKTRTSNLISFLYEVDLIQDCRYFSFFILSIDLLISFYVNYIINLTITKKSQIIIITNKAQILIIINVFQILIITNEVQILNVTKFNKKHFLMVHLIPSSNGCFIAIYNLYFIQ